jgi:signal-transduction protein with cAMP-binding, CBS, and nucleotidyltransferase domain
VKAFVDYIQTIHPLTQEAIDALLGICVLVPIKKNTILQPIGQTCRTIYYVKKGALRVFYFKGENDITDSMEFENAFVSRVESLISANPPEKVYRRWKTLN